MIRHYYNIVGVLLCFGGCLACREQAEKRGRVAARHSEQVPLEDRIAEASSLEPLALLRELGVIKKADWDEVKPIQFEDTSDLGEFVMSFRLPEDSRFRELTFAGPDGRALDGGKDLSDLQVEVIHLANRGEILKFRWSNEKKKFLRQPK
jgi:hypothetical protein